jgi:cellulase/cellobiase CelA1
VLQGFIRNPSSVKGELVLHGGTLTLHDHTVQSDNAIATITSRTDLIQAITDTTIAVDSGARQGAEYIMTVRGPVDSPTMNVQRGPGR